MSDMDEYEMIRASYVEGAYHPTNKQEVADGKKEFDKFMNKTQGDAWAEAFEAGRDYYYAADNWHPESQVPPPDKPANPYR